MNPPKSPPGAQHPPRAWLGQWSENAIIGCRSKFDERDVEYLSLSEHSALLSQAAAEARAEERGRASLALERIALYTTGAQSLAEIRRYTRQLKCRIETGQELSIGARTPEGGEKK